MSATWCLHALVKLPKPIPTQTGRPWRYRCTKCKLRFKIATGANMDALNAIAPSKRRASAK